MLLIEITQKLKDLPFGPEINEEMLSYIIRCETSRQAAFKCLSPNYSKKLMAITDGYSHWQDGQSIFNTSTGDVCDNLLIWKKPLHNTFNFREGVPQALTELYENLAEIDDDTLKYLYRLSHTNNDNIIGRGPLGAKLAANVVFHAFYTNSSISIQETATAYGYNLEGLTYNGVLKNTYSDSNTQQRRVTALKRNLKMIFSLVKEYTPSRNSAEFIKFSGTLFTGIGQHQSNLNELETKKLKKLLNAHIARMEEIFRNTEDLLSIPIESE